MEETNDNLVICKRCGSNCCQEVQVTPEVKTWNCLGCGYWSNSVLKKDSQFWKEQLEVLPNLYKLLSGEDENGNIWIPSYVTIKDKGVVFMSGTGDGDAKWAAVKSSDMKNGKWKEDTIHYFEEHDFMESLDYIGVFENKVEA